LGCAVTSIERTPRGVVVNDSHGGSDTYDHVVIASHSDQPLAMLSDADDRERAILGAIGYATNTIYLHRDIRLVSAVWCSRHSRAHFQARLC
jgi:predicted NAD/FAD-binding protein